MRGIIAYIALMIADRCIQFFYFRIDQLDAFQKLLAELSIALFLVQGPVKHAHCSQRLRHLIHRATNGLLGFYFVREYLLEL